MIWGKTNQDLQKAREKKLAHKKEISGIWRVCFAWSPVYLTNGQMLWLQMYEQKIDYSWSNRGYEYQIVKNRETLK